MVRASGKTDIYDLKVTLDVASELFRVEKDKVYHFRVLQDIASRTEYYNPKDTSTDATFENWDYVVHGTVFEVKELANDFKWGH